MNPEVKTMWLEALRSGEYKQTTERLRNGDAYCCLGVLCDLYAKHNPGAGFEPKDGTRHIFTTSGNYVAETLPPWSVQRWAGLNGFDVPAKAAAGVVRYDPQVSISLAAINDEGVSFEVIADIIEKFL